MSCGKSGKSDADPLFNTLERELADMNLDSPGRATPKERRKSRASDNGLTQTDTSISKLLSEVDNIGADPGIRKPDAEFTLQDGSMAATGKNVTEPSAWGTNQVLVAPANQDAEKYVPTLREAAAVDAPAHAPAAWREAPRLGNAWGAPAPNNAWGDPETSTQPEILPQGAAPSRAKAWGAAQTLTGPISGISEELPGETSPIGMTLKQRCSEN